MRPGLSALRHEIVGVALKGAGPHLIADLLLKVHGAYPEIDATEIYDLQERCNGCWRYASECDERPCGQARGAASEVLTTQEDVPPPAELPANAEVPF